jgi:hypothetical protein
VRRFFGLRTVDAAKCLLRVMSRHRVTSASCPLFPSKQTFIRAVARPLSGNSGRLGVDHFKSTVTLLMRG